MESAVAPANEEAVEAWNGVLFDRFVQYRDVLVGGLGAHGDFALEQYPPAVGDNVLDVGCGFGDSTRQIGELVGPGGSALGNDVAERFIALATEEAAQAGVENVSFFVSDIQAQQLETGAYDYVFSRFGTMFFANPVAALRNIRQSLVPRGRLCMVVWRQKPDNEWLHRAELAVEKFLDHPDPDETDEPTCGPGPFSMANADTVSGQLVSAGYERIELLRSDVVFEVGRTVEAAVELLMALGPAGEVIRLSGDKADAIRPELEAAIREAIGELVQEDGAVRASSSTWVVTANALA